MDDFWGDAIEIDDAIDLMRQAHYFAGLSENATFHQQDYTSTAGYLHLKHSETGAEDWLNLPSPGRGSVRHHLSQPAI